MTESAGPAAPHPALALVVEDEEPMRRFLRAALESAGYRVQMAETAKDGLREASSRSPDVIVLDLGLPDLDGLDVVRRLREWSAVPVVVLSARGRERDKIDALDAGADDYVTKPFAVGELLARVRVALRHAARRDSSEAIGPITVGDLTLDLERRRVSLRGAEVKLTPLEFKLLATLARSAGRVLTHDQLLREVWGQAHIHEHHYLRVYMGQLRHKLERDPSRPEILLTEPGVGYRMRES